MPLVRKNKSSKTGSVESELKPKKRSKKAEAKADLPAVVKKPKKSRDLPDSSVFEEGVDVISALPSQLIQDSEQVQEMVRMFDKLRDMATKLEQKFDENPSPQTVYALLKVYDQVRECIADLRALRDISQMGQLLNDEVITPLVQSIASAVSTMYQNIKMDTNKTLPPEYIRQLTSILDSHVQYAATEIEEGYQRSLVKTINVFGG